MSPHIAASPPQQAPVRCADDTGLHLPWGTVSWTPESALEFMDRLGIEKSIISISTPGIPYGDSSEVRDMARKVGLSNPIAKWLSFT